jgi:hypothetical protein
MVLTSAPHGFLKCAVRLPEPLPSGPFVLLAQDLVVDVLEEFELDGFAEAFGRLQSVEDDAASPAGEVLIKETDGAAVNPGQVALPLVPLVGFEVVARYARPRGRWDGNNRRSPGRIPGSSNSVWWSAGSRSSPSRTGVARNGVILRARLVVAEIPRLPSPFKPAWAQPTPSCVLRHQSHRPTVNVAGSRPPPSSRSSSSISKACRAIDIRLSQKQPAQSRGDQHTRRINSGPARRIAAKPIALLSSSYL